MPDVVLVCPEWPERALLRAQLLEEGYEVIATDAWPLPGLDRRRETKPRIVVLDLKGLPDPRGALDDVRSAIAPDRVLVLTAIGTLTSEEVRRLGFSAIDRPATIRQIVEAAARILSRILPSGPDPHPSPSDPRLT